MRRTDIGAQVRAARAVARLTQKQLAEMVGVAPSTVRALEKGDADYLRTLQRVADETGATLVFSPRTAPQRPD